MKRLIIFLFFLFCFRSLHAQDSFQLAQPLAKFESAFFKNSTRFELKFAHPGAKIYYTLNNKMPPGSFKDPTPQDNLYKKPLIFKNSFTTIRARVFSSNYRPSETVEFSFARDGKQIKKITSTAANSKYPGTGDSSLFDNKGGIMDLSSKTWIGFDKDTVNFLIDLTKTETVNSGLLSFLQNEDSWIFLPESILVYYFEENKKSYLPFGSEILFPEAKSPAKVNFRFIFPEQRGIKTNKLMINLITVKKIPDWHPAKGQHAWCFIDEIKIY
jgi:Fn3 associated